MKCLQNCTSLRCPTMVLKQCCVSRSHHFTKLSLELWTRQNPSATTQLTASEQGRYQFEAQLPRHQEVLVFEEQGLCDEVFMAFQPVQSTFVDDVPHDNVGVLKRRRFSDQCDQICHKKKQVTSRKSSRLTLEPVTSRAPSSS